MANLKHPEPWNGSKPFTLGQHVIEPEWTDAGGKFHPHRGGLIVTAVYRSHGTFTNEPWHWRCKCEPENNDGLGYIEASTKHFVAV